MSKICSDFNFLRNEVNIIEFARELVIVWWHAKKSKQRSVCICENGRLKPCYDVNFQVEMNAHLHRLLRPCYIFYPCQPFKLSLNCCRWWSSWAYHLNSLCADQLEISTSPHPSLQRPGICTFKDCIVQIFPPIRAKISVQMPYPIVGFVSQMLHQRRKHDPLYDDVF